jgi:hypothetical protein
MVTFAHISQAAGPNETSNGLTCFPASPADISAIKSYLRAGASKGFAAQAGWVLSRRAVESRQTQPKFGRSGVVIGDVADLGKRFQLLNIVCREHDRLLPSLSLQKSILYQGAAGGAGFLGDLRRLPFCSNQFLLAKPITILNACTCGRAF